MSRQTVLVAGVVFTLLCPALTGVPTSPTSMPRRARYRPHMTATQPAPAAARIPLARLAERPPSPTVARLLAQTAPRKAGGFNSSI